VLSPQASCHELTAICCRKAASVTLLVFCAAAADDDDDVEDVSTVLLIQAFNSRL
jgi:hypothetical protein